MFLKIVLGAGMRLLSHPFYVTDLRTIMSLQSLGSINYMLVFVLLGTGQSTCVNAHAARLIIFSCICGHPGDPGDPGVPLEPSSTD